MSLFRSDVPARAVRCIASSSKLPAPPASRSALHVSALRREALRPGRVGAQQQGQQHASHKPREGRKGVSTMALVSILGLTLPTTYLLSSIYPPTSLPLPGPLSLLVGPAPAPPPADPNSESGKAAMRALESALDTLPIVQTMRGSSGWYETRPHSGAHPSPHSLTASVLRGPSKLAVRPMIFAREDESEAVVVLHLGRSLCGHDGIIHGGMIATVFDESLARNALLNLPSKIGVTATLSISYKKPTKADQWVVIRTKLDKTGGDGGRKADVSGTMETLDGEVLASARVRAQDWHKDETEPLTGPVTVRCSSSPNGQSISATRASLPRWVPGQRALIRSAWAKRRWASRHDERDCAG